MSNQFVVYHKKEPGNKDLSLPAGHHHMATCLRSIIFHWQDHTQALPNFAKTYERYAGEEAYEFILKIICGLESPMLGETEIFGQFKEFVKNQRSSFRAEFSEIVNNLLRDTKKIRADYLQNIGCTSYGSLLRKQLRGSEQELIVLGAGSLAQDIFPWFAKNSKRVRAFTRTPSKHQQLVSQQTNLSVEEFGPIHCEDESVLVIASPLTSSEINQMCQIDQYSQVFDLRADSHQDRLQGDHVVTLDVLFADLESHRLQANQVKQSASVAIRQRATLFSCLEKPRPFGWEDLWTYA